MERKVLPLDAITVPEKRRRRDVGDIEALAASIRRDGLLHPITIATDGVLIAGRRRLEACRIAGLVEVDVHVVDLDRAVELEAAENGLRKQLAPTEVGEIARALWDRELEQARARKTSGVASKGERGRVRDRVARFVGVSGRTLEKLLAVLAASEKDPVAHGHLAALMDAEGVDAAHRKIHSVKPRATAAPPDASRPGDADERKAACSTLREIVDPLVERLGLDPSFRVEQYCLWHAEEREADRTRLKQLEERIRILEVKLTETET